MLSRRTAEKGCPSVRCSAALAVYSDALLKLLKVVTWLQRLTNLTGKCLSPLQSRGQSLKQECGFSAVLSDDSGASPDLLHQFNGLLAPWSWTTLL